MAEVYAAGDIGSNTAHLLIAASDGELVMRLENYNEWVSLGEVVARKGKIPTELVDQLVLALKEFRRMAESRDAKGFYIFATEALRKAKNTDHVLGRIRDEAGVSVDLIKPSREAELGLRGVLLDSQKTEANLLLEVGGGSAQVATLAGEDLGDKVSLPLGSGRVIAEAAIEYPCDAAALVRAERYLERELARCDIRVGSPSVLANGGVARGLRKALHPDGDRMLYLEELDYAVWACSRLSLDRIVERFRVEGKRAATLLPGALIYRALLRHFNADRMQVSQFGVREGAILEMAQGRLQACLN